MSGSERVGSSFSQLLVMALAVVLIAGCAGYKKEAPPAAGKKSDPVGDAIGSTGNIISDAGKVVIQGSGKVLTTTGEAISGAGAALDKAIKNFLGVSPEQINVQHRVVYATVGGEELTYDVFWPKGEGPFPMVINLHGGSWHKKNQEGFAEPMCRWLSKEGYVVFNVSYRLAPQHKFPAQVNDALGAIIHAKTNAAKYKGDPTRVAIMGDSAGGNLAALCALCWDNPYFKPSFTGDGKVTAQTHANVFLFAVYDLVWMYNMTGLWMIVENPKEIGKMYLGGSPAEVPEKYHMGSPVNHLRKDMSPTLIICGADDPLMPQSKAFHERLDAMGIRNGLYISVGDTHGFTALAFTKGATDCYNAINAFLGLELKHRRER